MSGCIWDAIARDIKERADWRCQVCGKQCRRPGEPFDTSKRTLTVAHLNHTESDCRPENLMAMCAPCHCRYDARTKAERRKTGRKTPDFEADIRRVRDETYQEMREAYLVEHDRWPRGDDADAIYDQIYGRADENR